MDRNNAIASLIAELQATLCHMEQVAAYHLQFRFDFPMADPHQRNYDLVILADIISDYYTCLETAFVRVSRFFENHLESDRWHKHLLQKMKLEIPGVRRALLREETFLLLDDFLRFRHFRRYYYDYHYDRDRMLFLESRFQKSLPLVREDVEQFIGFLHELRMAAR